MKIIYRILAVPPGLLKEFLLCVGDKAKVEVTYEITSRSVDCGLFGFVYINGANLQEIKKAKKVFNSRKLRDFFVEEIYKTVSKEPKN